MQSGEEQIKTSYFVHNTRFLTAENRYFSFVLFFRNWMGTIGDKTLRLQLHNSTSLGSLLPGVLVQSPAALDHLWEYLEHRSDVLSAAGTLSRQHNIRL